MQQASIRPSAPSISPDRPSIEALRTHAGKFEENVLNSREDSALLVLYGGRTDGVLELRQRGGGEFRVAWALDDEETVSFEEWRTTGAAGRDEVRRGRFRRAD